MLSHDPAALLADWLQTSNRAPDGRLHPSGDLIGSLRHSQLRAAGAPTRELSESSITNSVRLMTGTLWHSTFEEILRRKRMMFASEVDLTAYMPEGWSGTADWVFWSDEYKAFVLGDLKTIKGEGMAWINKDGVKDAHLWQLSVYWYALEKMGIPLVKAFVVLYLPINETSDGAKPSLQEAKPLDRDLVLGTMNDRWEQTKEYLKVVNQRKGHLPGVGFGDQTYLNEYLAPVQDREQVLRWDKTKGIFDLKLVPNWSTAYCPYPPELCDCHTQGQTKIGHYTLKTYPDECAPEEEYAEYVPRKGYEDIAPELFLSRAQIKKLKEEHGGNDNQA